MAVAIAFGLAVAMLMTLFVIPIIYSIVERIRFKPGELCEPGAPYSTETADSG